MRQLAIPLLACALCAQDPTLSPVLKRIRLYPNQAWMTRESVWTFRTAESKHFRLTGLPPDLALDNIRIRVEGIQGLKLGNVMVEQESQHLEPSGEVKAWELELKKLGRLLEDLDCRQNAIRSTSEALACLKPKGSQEGRDLTLNSEMMMALCRQIHDHQEKSRLRMEILTQEKSVLEQRKGTIEEELENHKKRAGQKTTSVLLELVSPQAGEARIILETQTSEARWRPNYEVRLDEGSKRLELLCHASVSQKSGEDWKGVDLEISNAEPGRNITLPSVPPPVRILYEAPEVIQTGRIEGRVMDSSGKPLAGVNIEAQCNAIKEHRRSTSDANGIFRIPLLPPGEYILRASKPGHPSTSAIAKVIAGKPTSLGLQLVNMAGATVEVVGQMAAEAKTDDKIAVNYSSEKLISGHDLETTPSRYEDAGELGRAWILDGKRDLPSDAIPRQILLVKTNLEPSITLQSVPRVSSAIHLTTSMPIPAGFPVFPGIPMAVVKNGERLGQTGFPRPEAGVGVTFNFGPVLGLRAQRERIQATVSNVKNGQGRQWTLRDQVLLVNDTDQDQEVYVLEPNLRSTSDRIRVEPLSDLPSQRKGDLLIWHLKIPAHGHKQLEEAWRIQGPTTGSVPELGTLGLPISD